jgi:N-acetylglucosaminyldiphosphoundecaprenol N-acetyl-beta-D-mannosaminyltransferase
MAAESGRAWLPARQSCTVLGVPVDLLTWTGFDEWLESAVSHRARATVLHANAHGLNLASRDPALLEAYRRADLVYCDGAGVMLAARLLGSRVPQRITGADWLWHLHNVAVEKGWRLFLLGSAPGVAERAAAALGEHSGASAVVGVHHGYFDRDGAEDDRVLSRIGACSPDIVLVGFGMPVQELWITSRRSRIDASVVVSQGAALDYVSGELRRGPSWLVDHGFEWLGRLLVEPRRLARRYLVGNPVFLVRVLACRVSSHRATRGPGTRR